MGTCERSVYDMINEARDVANKIRGTMYKRPSELLDELADALDDIIERGRDREWAEE